MRTFAVSFEIDVPDNITDGMLWLKFDSENMERELYEHLDGELKDEDEIIVHQINIYDKGEF